MTMLRRKLDVQADMLVSHTKGEVKITGQGDHIGVDLRSPKLGRYMIWKGRQQLRPATLRRADEALRSAGLSVDVTMRGRQVGRLGKDAKPALFDRLLGVAPVQFHYFRLIRSALFGVRS